jgi:hypothetical protein
MTRHCPFEVVTKVEFTELEKLRDVARKIAQNVSPISFDYWVEVRSGGIAFCFESLELAFPFYAYCISNHVSAILTAGRGNGSRSDGK